MFADGIAAKILLLQQAIHNDGGRCVGAIARDIRTGTLETFAAKTVILASGGGGQAYKPTTNALICTADGIAQAYRVGCPLMDMEMIQYHPTTLAENGFLITEGARGEGAHLYNALGELTEAGLLALVEGPGPRRFDANVTPHHHFRCRACHELHDVELENVDVTLRERGFQVQSAHVLLEGLCPRCAAAGEEPAHLL